MSNLESELYAIQLQNQEPSFYSRIPQIIDHLTYDYIDPKTGQTCVKKLSVYAKEFYRILKNIAGDHGYCWKNRDNLADDCNMSPSQITNVKQELQQKFHQLEGNSLIQIEKKQKTTIKEGHPSNKTWYDKICIINIWGFNNAFMRNLRFNREAPSPNDSARGAPSPNDSAPQGAPSPPDTNKITKNNNPLFKEQEPTADADSVCSLKKEYVNCSADSLPAYQYLLKIGFDSTAALMLIANYSIKDISLASKYVERQFKKKKAKGETIPNIVGYMRSTLYNRYWECRQFVSSNM